MKTLFLDKTTREVHLTAILPVSAIDAAEVVLRLFAQAQAAGATVVSAEIFAPKSFVPSFDFLKNTPVPVNWICPLDETSQPHLAGVHIVAISGATPQFFRSESGIKAAVYEDSQNVYLRSFGIVSPEHNDDGYLHTLDNLHVLETTLALGGFTFGDVVRTWFYNDDILAWYQQFNKGRTEFYRAREVFDKLLPASTGIGAPNPSGSKIISGVFAVKNKFGKSNGDKDFIFELPSPLQGGATEYGSSFSRAVELDTSTGRRIMISGTASIAPNGNTLYFGDIKKQVALTTDVIGAILKSRGMDFKDTINSVVYCRHPEFFAEFESWNAAHNIPFCPSYSIVCRDDLMFEIELEAAINK